MNFDDILVGNGNVDDHMRWLADWQYDPETDDDKLGALGALAKWIQAAGVVMRRHLRAVDGRQP